MLIVDDATWSSWFVDPLGFEETPLLQLAEIWQNSAHEVMFILPGNSFIAKSPEVIPAIKIKRAIPTQSMITDHFGAGECISLAIWNMATKNVACMWVIGCMLHTLVSAEIRWMQVWTLGSLCVHAVRDDISQVDRLSHLRWKWSNAPGMRRSYGSCDHEPCQRPWGVSHRTVSGTLAHEWREMNERDWRTILRISLCIGMMDRTDKYHRNQIEISLEQIHK